MWNSNTNCRTAREKKRARGRENFPTKSSNLRHSLASSQDKDWANTKGELAGWGPAHPPARGREAGKWQPEPRKASGNLSPGDGVLHQTVSRPPVLTKSFSDPRWLTSARRVTAWDQPPQRRHTAHLRRRSCNAPRKSSSWDQGGDKIHCTPGIVCSPSTCCLSSSDQEKGTKRRPNRVCTFVEYPRTWTWAA